MYPLHGEGHFALCAKIAVNAAVQFKNIFAARFLVQPVDVLRYDRGDVPFALPFGKFIMRRIGGNVGNEHLFAIKIVKLWVCDQKNSLDSMVSGGYLYF